MQSGYARQYANYQENGLGQDLETEFVSNTSSPDLTAMTTQTNGKKGNFWETLDNILSAVGDTATVVTEGYTSLDQALNPDKYRPAPPIVIGSQQGSGGQIYKTIAIVAGGALLLFAIIKLAK